jgi:MFS family permease
MPVVGRLLDKRGARGVVLIGTTTVVLGLGVFVYGITRHDVDLPVLMAGLAMFGIGSGCMMTPVSWAAVHTLNSSEVAHGSTLFNVNHNTAASVGAALISVILTSRLNAGAGHVAHDVSHAYAGVFVIAMILIAATAIPAWYLPKR